MSQEDLAKRLGKLSPEKQALVEQRLRGKAAPRNSDSAIPRRTHEGPIPLSHAQERLWILQQMEPDSTAYHDVGAARIRGPLKPEVLEQALHEVVRRHEVLRTSFVETENGPLQQVAATVDVPLPVVELREVPPAERDAKVRDELLAQSAPPFDLGKAPLLRMKLLRFAPEEHVLLFTLHHLINDGWSSGRFLQELGTLYAAFVEGRPSPLPPLSIQYGDFAAWQRQRLQGQFLSQQLEYWRTQLAGAPSALNLPTDFPRPPVQANRGARQPLALPRELVDRASALARAEGASLFMVLLTALNVLLQRYSGQSELLVGSSVANRIRPELEPLIGVFINTVVLRTELSDNPTGRQLLRRVRETTLSAFSHQELPFETLVAELKPERDLSRSPYFQVLLELHNESRGALPLGGKGLVIEPLEVDAGSSKVDLSFELSESPDGLRGYIEYDRDLFQPDTVARLARHFVTLLDRLVRTPDVAVGTFDILSPEERHALIVRPNQTARAWDTTVCFPEVFEAVVQRTPDTLAAFCNDDRLTYAQLNARANRVAHRLMGEGIGPERIVAVLQSRSLAYLVSVLGILKAGGAFVPLDAGQPRARLDEMLRQSGAVRLLTESRHAALARELAPTSALVFEELFEGPGREDNPGLKLHPRSLAYVMFTSGSTGTPKGAMIEHRGMLNHLRSKAETLGMDTRTVMAQTSTQTFDVSVWQLFSPLLMGGQVSIYRDEAAWEPVPLLSKMSRERVTIMETVPSHLTLMLEELEAHPGTYDLTGMRWMFLNGEALLPQLCQRWFRLFPGVPMSNSYGATECSDDTTQLPILSAPPVDGRYMPIHGNIPNLTGYALDSHLQPVPFGVPGEMYIGGIGVGRGYLGDPFRTASVFVPDPFSPEPGARMYKTGDRVRVLPDGSIDFLGRVDHQVKVRGHRIEVGEIETVLSRHPDVRECVVLAKPTTGTDHRLVAYVSHAGVAPSTQDLANFIRATLPEYMVPSAFVVLDAFPLLSNGKINRRALPEPVEAAPSEPIEPPRTEIEKLIADVWAEQLEVKAVGRQSNFFELGGHSLLAVKTMSRLRSSFGVELSVRDLFEGKTVAEVARRIEGRQGGGKGDAAAVFAAHPLEPVGEREYYELAPYQLPEWFLHELEPDALFNISFAEVLFVGDLQVDAFVQAMQVMVDRHAAFRTYFGYVDSRPVQKIRPHQKITREDLYVDRTQVPEAEVEDEMRRVAAHYTGQPFDFERGPLFVIKLVEFPGKRFLLVFHTHHIVWDELSTMLMSRELSELYSAFVEGRTPELRELPLAYVDFAHWVNQAVKDGTLEAQRQHWLKKFEEPPAPLELPTDFPRHPIQTFSGGEVGATLPRALRQELNAFLRKHHTTLNIFLTAVLDAVLYRLTGQQDFVVGTPFANRGDEKLEPILGLFATALPLRCRVTPGLTFRGLLEQVRQESVEAFDNHLYPSVLAIQEINPQMDLSRNRLFSVMYGLQNDKTRLFGDAKFTGLEVRLVPDVVREAIRQTAPFDVTWVFDHEGEDLTLKLNYNTDLFKKSTAQRFIDQYFLVVEQVVSQPDAQLATLELMRPAERQRVLESFNATQASYPVEVAVHELVEAQVDRTPDAPALCTDERTLSYRALEEEVNQWAHYLMSLGLEPEAPVALLLGPSEYVPIIVLAVWKAGLSYVPLSAQDPPTRQRKVVEESGARVLLMDSPDTEIAPPGVRCLPIRQLAGEVARLPKSRPGIVVHPRQRAYILFTSGSTGAPKGIEIDHRGIANMIGSTQEAYHLTAKDTLLAVIPLSFDPAVQDLFWPLSYGARIACAAPGDLQNPVALSERVRRYGVTIFQVVPTVMGELLDGIQAGTVGRMPSVRLIMCGGAFMARSLRDRFFATFSCQLGNHYGPSEVTVDATHFDCGTPFTANIAPIGKPVKNGRVYVLDSRLQAVPLGVSGEICVASPGLARGYLGDPVRTARSFIPDPFGTEPGARLYRTGDLGRFDEEGNLHFLGRVDKQVKVRGHRVEIEEIESRLVAHPAVSRGVVHVTRQPKGVEFLSAYVELKDGYSRIHEGTRSFRLFTLAQRPELKAAMDRIHQEAWPEYFVGDSAMKRYWPRLATEFPEYQYALLDGQDQVVAVGNALPIHWKGTVADLPPSWDAALERGFEGKERGVTPDTFFILTGVVASSAQGQGLATVVLKAFKTLAHAFELQRVLVAVRPTGKAARPELGFEEYCALRRPDGALVDDWLRTHERVGGRILKLELRSQYIRAGIEDWERWAGEKFSRSGEYRVKDTLQPVRIDVEARFGEYYDPSVWMEHPSEAGSRYAWQYVDDRVLRDALRGALPEYMVPQEYRFLSVLPLTSAGKLDERALQSVAPLATRREQPRPPRNSVQERLVAAWRQVLSVEEVGTRDDFFALGGHSIRAVEMLSRVTNLFHTEVSLRDFYRDPTVEGLERLLGKAQAPLVEMQRSGARPHAQPGVGFGESPAHHGEILQGVFEISPGKLQRGLVSLPYPLLNSEAVFTPDATGIVRVEPAWKVKALRAAELALTTLGSSSIGGLLEIKSNIPVGWGLGSSTSDVVASLRAVSHALQKPLPVQLLASLAVKAEQASDSIMFGDRAVLFAHRGGSIIEDLGGPLPAVEVLGFNTSPNGGGIDTLKLERARYSPFEIESFRVMAGLLRRAVRTQDPRLLGHVASASARISQRHLPKPHFKQLLAVAESVGALGVQVAHSGTVAGLLFDPADPSREAKILRARNLIAEFGYSLVRGFRSELT